MSDPVVAPERRRPSILLIVSLCLNMALIGGAAVMFFRGFGPPPREARGTLSPMALMRMVPAEKDKIRAVMDKHHARIGELHRQAMDARKASFDLLAADNFDAQAYGRSLSAIQNADAALGAESMIVTAESVAVLTPEERKDVAEKVRKPRFWKRMFRHGR